MLKTRTQDEWIARAQEVLPAGGFGNFDPTVFIRDGKGARVWDEDISFREAVESDEEILQTVGQEGIDAALSLERTLRNTGRVFERIGIEAEEMAGAR